MVEVRTREDAIIAVDRALVQWGPSVSGVLTQAIAITGGAEAHASDVLRRCTAKIAALEGLHRAATGDERRRIELELTKAHDSRARADRAHARVVAVRAQVAMLTRAHSAESEPHVASARATLSRMLHGLQQYRGGGSTHPDPYPDARTAAPPNAGSEPFAPLNLQDVNVEAADLDDTPIVGPFGRGGASRADYRWAVQTWADVVEPGIRRGLKREDFAQRDANNRSSPLRRTADVYDLFVGSDRIRVDQRPDGSLNIVNGRHRLAIARELGIHTLPGQVS